MQVLRIKKLNNSWEKMVKHARECCLTENHELIAYHNEAANVVLFFNCVYDLVGAEFAGDYIPQDNFDASKKVHSEVSLLYFRRVQQSNKL